MKTNHDYAIILANLKTVPSCTAVHHQQQRFELVASYSNLDRMAVIN